MEENAKDKAKKWTIRMTFEERHCAWNARSLLEQVLQLIQADGKIGPVYWTRVEVDDGDY